MIALDLGQAEKMRPLATILGLLIIVGLFALTGALGLFEPMTKAVGYFTLGGCPLLWALIQGYLFHRAARAQGMPGALIAATFAALITLSAALIVIVAEQIVAGFSLFLLGAALCVVVARRAPNLSGVFLSEDLNWNGNAYPAAPASRFATLATVQVILGVASILFVRFTPTLDNPWIYYGPLALLAASGAVLQIYYLKVRARRAAA
ncbi:MAG TPA: hypothetical protein VJV39_24930 [Dongiaceae bacterium]|nr:hypothetical protein [Dongiaceae bacterium]